VFRQSIKSIFMLALAIAFAVPAHAGWREDLGTFRIGLSASDTRSISPDDLGKLEAGYAKALGMPVTITVLRDYPALIDAHVSGRIEYAVYSSTAYASAWLLCECVEPLVAPVLANGATGIRSALIVNAATPFTRLDLNGIKVGIPGKDSITGFAVPLAAYTIGKRALSQDESFFTQFRDLETTAAAFADGNLDAFFGWMAANETGPVAGAGIMGSGADKTLSVQGQSIEIKVPWTSKLLRFGPHAVRRDLNGEAKAALVSFLSSADIELLDMLSITQAADVQQLVPARHAEYELAIQAAKAAAAVSR
jgi:phosphonate transport system substrate-binding protein